ncbi:MAG: hypothetical protein ACF8TS_16170, partial [Maioricimonas sp. JB049]
MSSTPEPTTSPTTGKNDDSDWGFKPRKSGMSGESKIALMLVVCLAGAFTFVVYKKLEGRKQLLAQDASFEDSVPATPADAAPTDAAPSPAALEGDGRNPDTAGHAASADTGDTWHVAQQEPALTRAGVVRASQSVASDDDLFAPPRADAEKRAHRSRQDEPESVNPFAPAESEPATASARMAANDSEQPVPLFDFNEPARAAAAPEQPVEEENPFAPRDTVAQSPPRQGEPQFEPGPIAGPGASQNAPQEEPAEPDFSPFAPPQSEPEPAAMADAPAQTQAEPNPFFVDEGPSSTETIDAWPAEFTPFPAAQTEPGPAMTPPRHADSAIQPVQHERASGDGLEAEATIEIVEQAEPQPAPEMEFQPTQPEPADDPFFMPV